MKGIRLNGSSVINNDTRCHTQTGVFERARLSDLTHMFSHLLFSQPGYLKSSGWAGGGLKKTWLFRQFKGKILEKFYIILMSWIILNFKTGLFLSLLKSLIDLFFLFGSFPPHLHSLNAKIAFQLC